MVKATYEAVRRLPGVGKLAERVAQQFSLGYVTAVRQQLDKISPTICAAKWLQSTVHLEIGETHSCHHPKRHVIPSAELARSPRALHSTEFKKVQRTKMLNGERPLECEYCWAIEDLPGTPLSDRHYKSAEDWARPYLHSIAQTTGSEDVDPTYLELSFSSNCQMRCSYCYSSVSSAIRAEVAKHGPYPTKDAFGTMDAVLRGPEYAEAFWRWWPELRSQLHVFRLTGGEPLLEEDTFRVMQSFLSEPLPKLKFSLNTNLMISEERFQRFHGLAKDLIARKALGDFHLYTSLDTWGEQAEWIRHGLELKTFTRNLEAVLRETPTIGVTLMVTFNALSPFRFKELMDYVLWCRSRYPAATLKMGVSVLHHPAFLALDVLPKKAAPLLEDLIAYHRANDMNSRGAAGFSAAEVARFERVVTWWKARPSATAELEELKKFVLEYDRRKGSDFNRVFPHFWEQFA